MTPLIPENISLAIGFQTGQENTDRARQEAVAHVLRGENSSLAQNLGLLGRHFKIKIWFSEPVTVQTPYTRWTHYTDEYGRDCMTKKCQRQTSEHVFNGFFYQHGYLYSMLRQNGRTGYPFDHCDKIVKWELILDQKGLKIESFSTYEQFRKKFDTFFITEDEIQRLWNGTSGQHGGKYVPSDFRRMGPQGLKLMQKFLRFFKGVNEGGGSGYHKSSYGDYFTYDEHYDSDHHSGRDISITHQTNCGVVHYSSEYHGCGNGRYGLVANKKEFLWLEDD